MVDWVRRTFDERTAFLVTMHQKEQVIAPALRDGAGLRVETVGTVNTDLFGTFSGERTRLGSAVEAARAKIAAGLSETPSDAIGLASEGSFGPDPTLPLIPIGREIIVFFDAETGLEVIGKFTDHQPCFHHACVSDVEGAAAFADRVGFPDHGVIVCSYRDGKPNPAGALFKDSFDLEELERAVSLVLHESETAFLQTDMRAHRNPTRMRTIGAAAEDLVRRLHSRCPSCGCPGYDVTEWLPGRRCVACGLPTRVVQSEILNCKNCGYRENRRSAGPDRVEPAVCDYCNP